MVLMTNLNKLMPKVLIAAPTSDRHGKLLDEWIGMLNKLTYPNFDLVLIDTTLEKDDYFNKLKTKKLHDKEFTVLRYNWDTKNEYAIQMLAHAREQIRQYFLEHKEYDYLFWLDTDIFLPVSSIQRLLSYDKDNVGFYVHVYPKGLRKPCIFKSGQIILGHGLDYYSFKEINEYKSFVKNFRKNKLTDEEKNLIPFIIKDTWRPQLLNPYALNLGCLMVRRNVVEVVPFRTHPKFLFGEDLWYFNEANDKKFEFWCDTDIRPEHKNVSWNEVCSKEPKRKGNNGFYIAMGPEKADKIVFLERGKKK
jgi:hypothetical protein